MIYNYNNIKIYNNYKSWFDNYKLIEKKKLPTKFINKECSICLEDFKNNEKIIILKECKHSFHIDCIKSWLSIENICPLCRNITIQDGLKYTIYNN